MSEYEKIQVVTTEQVEAFSHTLEASFMSAYDKTSELVKDMIDADDETRTMIHAWMKKAEENLDQMLHNLKQAKEI